MNDTQAKSLSRTGLAAVVAAGLTTFAAPASAADVLLSGTIASASGEKMGGVTVFGLPTDLPIWIDARVMDRERIVLAPMVSDELAGFSIAGPLP